jgi:5-methyltetrahydrofolate--homocysteine methyltransferase
VGVVAGLLDSDKKRVLDAENRQSQDQLRYVYVRKREKPLLAYPDALANHQVIDWRPEEVPEPAFQGLRVVDDVPLERIAEYIDWTFFFSAWELKGRFPRILDHPKYGAAARELYENGRAMLEKIIADGSLVARGVYGFWPAASEGDDIVVYADAERNIERARFFMLRQQGQMGDGKPNRSLADFIAPRDRGVADHLGAFAVTAGLGAEDLAARYERELDDYNAILVKSLADRLAEAFAEYLHSRARRDWGFGGDEGLSNEELIAEKYRGIRPAFGYPACPDHCEKGTLFELLDAPAVGIELTESFAMTPAASVSGLYFAHPAARYFTVGRIDRDQVGDYARRKGVPLAEVERWLAPNLGYDPEA